MTQIALTQGWRIKRSLCHGRDHRNIYVHHVQRSKRPLKSYNASALSYCVISDNFRCKANLLRPFHWLQAQPDSEE